MEEKDVGISDGLYKHLTDFSTCAGRFGPKTQSRERLRHLLEKNVQNMVSILVFGHQTQLADSLRLFSVLAKCWRRFPYLSARSVSSGMHCSTNLNMKANRSLMYITKGEMMAFPLSRASATYADCIVIPAYVAQARKLMNNYDF